MSTGSTLASNARRVILSEYRLCMARANRCTATFCRPSVLTAACASTCASSPPWVRRTALPTMASIQSCHRGPACLANTASFSGNTARHCVHVHVSKCCEPPVCYLGGMAFFHESRHVHGRVPDARVRGTCGRTGRCNGSRTGAIVFFPAVGHRLGFGHQVEHVAELLQRDQLRAGTLWKHNPIGVLVDAPNGNGCNGIGPGPQQLL